MHHVQPLSSDPGHRCSGPGPGTAAFCLPLPGESDKMDHGGGARLPCVKRAGGLSLHGGDPAWNLWPGPCLFHQRLGLLRGAACLLCLGEIISEVLARRMQPKGCAGNHAARLLRIPVPFRGDVPLPAGELADPEICRKRRPFLIFGLQFISRCDLGGTLRHDRR